MKQQILILTIFLTISASGQRCPPGYSHLSFYSTGQVLYLMDTCVTDSAYKRIMLKSEKNGCGETASSTMDANGFFHEHRETWINDSVGCERREIWGKYVLGKEIELSKCKFYYESGWCNSKIKKSCCGHIHKTKP